MDYSDFQKKLLKIVEDELLDRLEENESKIHCEAEILEIVADLYDEVIALSEDIRAGDVGLDRPSQGDSIH